MKRSAGGLTSNPLVLIAGQGLVVTAAIALAIALTRPVTGIAVGPGPQTDLVEKPVPAAAARESITNQLETIADDDATSEVEPTTNTDLPIETLMNGATGPSVDRQPFDASEAIEESTDGDIVGSKAPAPGRTFIEQSGNAIYPEETNKLTEPVYDRAVSEPELAGDETGEAFVNPDDESIEYPSKIETPSELETDLVVDPDRGTKGGQDPDGGAAPFYPTPSGPEGNDSDPLTIE
jgi:hypothetical protein